jgi:hypothetical protein
MGLPNECDNALSNNPNMLPNESKWEDSYYNSPYPTTRYTIHQCRKRIHSRQ